MKHLAFKIGTWLVSWSNRKITQPVSVRDAFKEVDMRSSLSDLISEPNQLLKDLTDREK